MATPPETSPAPVTIAQVKDEAELMQALAIREVVFIEEQHVPEGIERDAEDANAFHVLAYQGGHAIGTGRLVMMSEPPPGQQGKWGQIGRMAVLQSHRKARVGSKLLIMLENEARNRGVGGVMLHAQLYALEFYKRHGYEALGPVFQEGGIDHLEMHKRL
ncbi:GNAT family N-acetyltransferase [Corallococcus sp. H22C18031201]|uniref:GNAT family N-acetyltransferase n=1 Tax=Citreicoccus inhibens TaxID=2849499 RepID=UPI000E72807C|nr:GNAT family N-acetyltransferase [Citreicoccus inhibens]MBU8900065.1 GNAT family N-acetyltransferase [Citreicoccus inhibens]RJS20667.1 GNAT family N-acetyltransferase [Corallococcus sp. H22C18031201]